MRTASISADRKSTVVVGTRDQAAAVERAEGTVTLTSSGTGPKIGSARIGPKFGLADSSIAVALRLASKLRTSPFAVAARSSVSPMLIALAKLTMSLPLRVSAFKLLARLGTTSAIAVDQRLAARIACAGSLVPRPRPLARISGRSSLLPPRAIPKARVARASAIGTVKMVTTAKLAGKDCSVDVPVSCAGAGANRDGQDLMVDDDLVASYIGFDLTSYPAGATVQSATLSLRVKTAPATLQTIDSKEIANADEGWSETGIVCGNRPAEGTTHQSFSSGTAADVDINVALNSAWLTRLSARMGIGYCTLLLRNAANNPLATVFESTDEGTNDALGPRLALTFALP